MLLLKRLYLLLILTVPALRLLAQPKLSFDLLKNSKSKEFKERKLPSEKMAVKKNTKVMNFTQGLFTHYNYFFNANAKLNEIIAEAKLSYIDDYTKLLSFYPYSLDQTAPNAFLDTVLQKCTAGILLHDLRNPWIDDMYLVMGKAYLMAKKYDSAAMTFQYINFSFAPKEKDGYDKYIGSNAEEGSNSLTIATKEKKGTFAYVGKRRPSRNESFVWQVRTLTEDSNYIDASSLIDILRNDPNFPPRLKEELAEARAYLYYKMEMWDSSATYLGKAISVAENRTEKARWWYLSGQMYQRSGNYKKATDAFAKCTSLSLDPVMEIYARLNTIRLNKSDDPKIIDQNIAALESMARKDRYENYRDIIYYAAGLFELERNGYDAATVFLKKSIKYNTENAAQRSRSFMLLGDVAYQGKKYGPSSPIYDSVNAILLADTETSKKLDDRKPGVNQVYDAEKIITLQDSLLALSAMPEESRMAKVKQLSKKLSKEKGLKTDVNDLGSAPPEPVSSSNKGNSAPDPVGPSASGTWYFYDKGVRTTGYNSFKQKWGTRPNVDNWRRSASIKIQQPIQSQGGDVDMPLIDDGTRKPLGDDDNYDTADVSFDNMYSRIPLSDERKEKADNKAIDALYLKAQALHEKIEDYPEAIKVYEEILRRRDTGEIAEKSLFGLVHCYNKLGDVANANRCKQLLQKGFPDNKNNDKLAGKSSPATDSAKLATAEYKRIYDLFISGDFANAVASKQAADSSFGNNFWSPQLLYIESVYYIRQREDSVAIVSLTNIETKFATHPLAPKAKTMIDVLGRRKEIEDYLTKLQVTRVPEDSTILPTTVTPAARIIYTKPLDSLSVKKDSLKTTLKDSAGIKPLDAVKTASKDSSIAPAKDTTNGFKGIDTSAGVSVGNNPVQPKDTIPKLVIATATTPSPYTINPYEAYNVAIVLERVDPSYVNEVLYAFNNSSRKNFNGKPVQVIKQKLRDGLWLVLLTSDEFKDAGKAFDYVSYIKPIGEKELITWLDASKYHYTIISNANLSLIKQDMNLPLYQQVLKETFPGKL